MPDAASAIINPADRTSGRTLDHAAAVYDVLSPLMTFGLERGYRRRVLELLALQGHERILDIGCGTGTLTREMARTLDDKDQSLVVGVDAAVKMIEVARKKAADISNIRYDADIAEELAYEDEYFDRAVSTFFYHHIDSGLKAKSLAETWRVLKPGGRFIIVDVDIPTNWFGNICAYSGYFLFHQDEIKENIKGVLRSCMEESPFQSWRQVSHHSGYISIFELTK